MAEYSENDSESTSSESPSANTTEGTVFYFTSSERGPSGLPPSKVNHSVDNSSSEEDDEGEGDRRTDSSSSSSGESNAEKTAKSKSIVTFSTSAPSAVDKSVLLGNPLALRTSVRSSSSVGGEEDSPLLESDDTEFGFTHAHKRQASDASGTSPPPPKRMSQVAGGTDGGMAGTNPGVEYSDFARRMMVSHLMYKCTMYIQLSRP